MERIYIALHDDKMCRLHGESPTGNDVEFCVEAQVPVGTFENLRGEGKLTVEVIESLLSTAFDAGYDHCCNVAKDRIRVFKELSDDRNGNFDQYKIPLFQSGRGLQ